jgi:hypothetical protein
VGARPSAPAAIGSGFRASAGAHRIGRAHRLRQLGRVGARPSAPAAIGSGRVGASIGSGSSGGWGRGLTGSAGSGGWRRRQSRVSVCPSAPAGARGHGFQGSGGWRPGLRRVGRVGAGGMGGSRVPRRPVRGGSGGLPVRLPGETETDSGGDRLRPFSPLAAKPPNPRYR